MTENTITITRSRDGLSERITITRTRDGYSVRIRCGRDKGGRPQNPRFTIKTRDEREAGERALDMSEVARMMVTAGIGFAAPFVLEKAAEVSSDPELFDDKIAAAKKRCAARCKTTPPAPSEVMFRELGERWTSGELAERYPDHVKIKRTADKDRGLLQRLYKTIGPVPLADFRLEDAERAMAALPKGRSPATRRHYAQLIAKVLAMAVYPLRLIERSPLPRGFLPRIGQRPAFAYLYPSEDAQLLGRRSIPLAHRMLYGVLAREGLRISEALALRWHHVDLAHGTVRLDRNKTGVARAWALDPGVTAALAAFRRGAAPEALVFVGVTSKKAAKLFREHLVEAGVDRSELHERTAERRPLRIHDLRATFITLELASGRSETWVQDRTGHTTSLMLNKYRRQARHAAELAQGKLAALLEAIPELSQPDTEIPLPQTGGGEPEGEPRPEVDGPVVDEFLNDSSGSPSRGRTGKPLPARDFKSPASAIPPRGQPAAVSQRCRAVQVSAGGAADVQGRLGLSAAATRARVLETDELRLNRGEDEIRTRV